MHSNDEIMESIGRLEDTIFGDPSRGMRGLYERVNQTETYVMEIRNDLRRITWIVLVGVIGASLNLVINAKNLAIISHQLQQPQQQEQQK